MVKRNALTFIICPHMTCGWLMQSCHKNIPWASLLGFQNPFESSLPCHLKLLFISGKIIDLHCDWSIDFSVIWTLILTKLDSGIYRAAAMQSVLQTSTYFCGPGSRCEAVSLPNQDQVLRWQLVPSAPKLARCLCQRGARSVSDKLAFILLLTKH